MNDHERTDQIERDIERTRADMSATIDAIQSKLTPGQMVDQAMGYLRTSLPADFGRNLSDTARNNPVPIVLIGVGIAWLAMAGRNGGSARLSGVHGDGSSLGERAHEAAGRLHETGSSLTERAREAAGRARDTVSQRVRGAQQTAQHATERSRQAYERTRSTVSNLVDEQPLVLGALGLAVGAALGAAVPRTEREDALMGDARDELMDRATESAHTYAERAGESARRAVREHAEGSDGSDTSTPMPGEVPRSAGSV